MPISDTRQFQNLLFSWFDQHKRILPWRETKNPYFIWVSEIMLQQTRVETVIPYYHRFIERLPSVKDLAECHDDELFKLWQGLGYYRRASHMKKAANQIVNGFGGAFPRSAKELLTLPGIGAYTAGAIASIAYGERVSAVDGNVLRVFSRILGIKESIAEKNVIETISRQAEALLPEKRTGDFNEALMEIGATVCLPNGAPLCGECPLSSFCYAYKNNLTAEIPLKSEKKMRPKEDYTILIVRCDGRIAVEKRSENVILPSLWQFPMLSGKLTFNDCQKVFPFLNDENIALVTPTMSHIHIFTHKEWHMTGYAVDLLSFPPDFPYKTATKEEIEKFYSVPSAFKPFIRYIDIIRY